MRTMAALLAAGRAPAELMHTYAKEDAARGRKRALHLRQWPQMEALPWRGPGQRMRVHRLRPWKILAGSASGP
jgi:hypothetical protein